MVRGSKARPDSAAVEVAVVVVEVGNAGLDSLSFWTHTAASRKSFGRVNLSKKCRCRVTMPRFIEREGWVRKRLLEKKHAVTEEVRV